MISILVPIYALILFLQGSQSIVLTRDDLQDICLEMNILVGNGSRPLDAVNQIKETFLSRKIASSLNRGGYYNINQGDYYEPGDAYGVSGGYFSTFTNNLQVCKFISSFKGEGSFETTVKDSPIASGNSQETSETVAVKPHTTNGSNDQSLQETVDVGQQNGLDQENVNDQRNDSDQQNGINQNSDSSHIQGSDENEESKAFSEPRGSEVTGQTVFIVIKCSSISPAFPFIPGRIKRSENGASDSPQDSTDSDEKSIDEQTQDLVFSLIDGIYSQTLGLKCSSIDECEADDVASTFSPAECLRLNFPDSIDTNDPTINQKYISTMVRIINPKAL